MSKTITLEGAITAVDTATGLTSQGSVTSPSTRVPVGSTMIKRILAAVGVDMAAVGSATFCLRLGGNAVKNGEQVIHIASAGGQDPQAGSDAAPARMMFFELKDADIEVVSDTIRVQAEMDGQDLGTAEVAVTLIFA